MNEGRNKGTLCVTEMFFFYIIHCNGFGGDTSVITTTIHYQIFHLVNDIKIIQNFESKKMPKECSNQELYIGTY